jgi:hypothetical protein
MVCKATQHNFQFLLTHFLEQPGFKGFTVKIQVGSTLGAQTFILNGDEVVHVNGGGQTGDNDGGDNAYHQYGGHDAGDHHIPLVREEAGGSRGGGGSRRGFLGRYRSAAAQTELAVVIQLGTALFTKHSDNLSFYIFANIKIILSKFRKVKETVGIKNFYGSACNSKKEAV